MSKATLARFVSVVSDPFIEGTLLFMILFLLKSEAPVWLLPLLLFFSAFLPVIFLTYGMRVGIISDWETTDRSQRHGLNIVCLLGIALDLVLIFLFGNGFLLRLFLIFLVLMAFYTLITFFWKISGHLTANTAFFWVINLFFGLRFWWLVFLLPLVGWARVIRQKHDLGQVLGGFLLSTMIILCGHFLLF